MRIAFICKIVKTEVFIFVIYIRAVCLTFVCILFIVDYIG